MMKETLLSLESYNLPVKQVITSKKADEKVELPFVEEGIMINSGDFNGLSSKDALIKIAEYVEEKNLGQRTYKYRLKDWGISRQRYWGTPIPVLYCEKMW